MERYLHNPIMPGFYPDPSICRVGENYYMVNSTFEFFPGVPIFHSRDLVHWRQIGYCLNRPSQLNLDGVKASKGIYAPTIRYHKGIFYMITTLVNNKKITGNMNFFVTASDPAGPWSEPIIVRGAGGIDPTIFFDDDGKAYYLGKRRGYPELPDNLERHIWIQELDIKNCTLGAETVLRTTGAVEGDTKPEGPHIYKRNGWYYLLIAEGGTGFNHAVSVFRSRCLTGPYECNKRNPIITHRAMSHDCKINSTGHADLVETQNGEWWAVMLACRPYGGFYHNLGRETFAAPVIWEDDWPVISPQTGHVEFQYRAPDLPECKWDTPPHRDGFDSETLALCWNHLRTPRKNYMSLSERPGWLRLRLMPERLSELTNPAFIGRRQQHMNFHASVMMDFIPKRTNETAGLCMLLNNDYHLRFMLTLNENDTCLTLVRRLGGQEQVLASKIVSEGKLRLMIEASGQDYSFRYALAGNGWTPLAEGVDGRFLSKDVAGGFTGAFIGMYASSNGEESANTADFDWFEYSGV